MTLYTVDAFLMCWLTNQCTDTSWKTLPGKWLWRCPHSVTAGPDRCLFSKTTVFRLLQSMPVTLVIILQIKDFMSYHQLKPSELKHQNSSKTTSYISHELRYLNDRLGTKAMFKCQSRILIRWWWDSSPAATQFPWGQDPLPSWFYSPK